VHHKFLLHTERTGRKTELVVLRNWIVHHSWWGIELWFWSNSWRCSETLAVYLSPCWSFIPDSPVTAWFLNEEERAVAIERLRAGQTGIRCNKFKMSQIKEAVLDIKVWLVALMMASAYTVNGAVSGFGPLIVSTFGWSTRDSVCHSLAVFPSHIRAQDLLP